MTIENFIFRKLNNIWYAVDRDHYFDLNNDIAKVMYRSKSVVVLEELIKKTNGDPSKLAEITNTKDVSFQNIMDETEAY